MSRAVRKGREATGACKFSAMLRITDPAPRLRSRGDLMNRRPEEALRAYVAAFETLDPDAVASFYHLPCVFVGPPGVTVVADASAARGMARALIEHARGQGYRRTEIRALETRALAESLASATGVFVRFGSEGKEISRFGFAYTLLREAAVGWRIVVAVAHDAPSDLT